MRNLTVLAILTACTACGVDLPPESAFGRQTSLTAPQDAGVDARDADMDPMPRDAGDVTEDAGEMVPDSGEVDAGQPEDAGEVQPDAGESMDAGSVEDAGEPDSGSVEDAGPDDAGVPDSGMVDAGSPCETNGMPGCVGNSAGSYCYPASDATSGVAFCGCRWSSTTDDCTAIHGTCDPHTDTCIP